MFTQYSQAEFEELTAKQKHFFEPIFKEFLSQFPLDPERIPFLTELLSLMAKSKRLPITAVVSSLLNHGTNAQEVANKVEQAITEGFISFDGTAIIITYDVDPETQETYKNLVHPYPLTAKPKTVTNSHECGYWYIKEPLVLRSKPPKWVPLDHVNIVNAVPYRITNLIQETENHWAGLDQRLQNETFYAYEERKKRFSKFNTTARQLQEAMTDRPVWFVHQYDKRGRVYTSGYHINPQGNDWQKSCIEFFNKKLCTE